MTKTITNFHDLIHNRRSIRNYDPDQPVSDETLHKILEAGRVAPSAANFQPWKFIVVKSPELREKVNQCYHQPWFHDAPAVLVVVGYPDRAWVKKDGFNAIQIDLTIAMDHMILASTEEGVGTCWIAAFDEACLRKALNLQDNEVVYCITPLGYPRKGYKKEHGPKRKKMEEVAEFR